MPCYLLFSNILRPGLFRCCFGFSSPILGIGIKDKHALIRESQIKDERKEQDRQQHQVLQPDRAAGAFMVGCKGEKRKEEHEHNLKLLTVIHFGRCVL